MEVAERPKYCPECGQKAAEKGQFCGGCGKALAGSLGPARDQEPTAATSNPTLALRTESDASSFRAALLLGGIWTVVNRLHRAGAAVWLSRLASLAWLWGLASFLDLWRTYLVGDKARLNDYTLVSVPNWLFGLSVAALALNIPLARTARGLLRDADQGLQRRQALLGLALQCAVVLAVYLTLSNNETLKNEVHTAWIAGGQSAPYPPGKDPYAPILKNPPTDAEVRTMEEDLYRTKPTKGPKVPWNGMGLDPNFPVR